MQKIENYINGELVAPNSETYLDNYEPASGAIYSLIPDSDAVDVQNAVEAAQNAFQNWSQDVSLRVKTLNKIADLIEENLELFAQAESKDNGKPVTLAKSVDIPRSALNFRFYATALTHWSSESHLTDKPSAINYTVHHPIGVAACISPWNLPLYLFTWKIAPALAAGNCVVAKPSEITPMTAYLLSKICIEAGLPKGVLNIVHGLGAKVGQKIIEHPDIPIISFTGGTETGKRIAGIAAPMFKKMSLELGGKNPNIVFADCDFDDALETSVRSSFANQGQICLCSSRIFVERSIYEKFRDAFVAKVKQLKVGDPLDESSNLGAVVSKSHQEKVLSYVALAQKEGGKILTGGHAVQLEGRCKNGYFIEPTVIEGLDFDCRTNQEEVFGALVTIMPFDTEEEVITYANSTPYGLSATIWTDNLKKSQRVAHQIKAGIIWINTWMLRDLRTPFGGMKQSGVGREGGFEVLRFFTEPQNVCIKL